MCESQLQLTTVHFFWFESEKKINIILCESRHRTMYKRISMFIQHFVQSIFVDFFLFHFGYPKGHRKRKREMILRAQIIVFFVNKVTFTSRHITSNCCLQIMMNLFRQFDYKIMHLNVINNMLIECDRQIND